MKLVFAFFAESIVLTEDGRFHVLNGSTTGLKANSYPTTIANLGLLARFSFGRSEFGQEIKSKVQAFSPTGAELMPALEAKLRPVSDQKRPEGAKYCTVHFHYDGFTPPVAGEYRFVIHLNDQPVGEITIDAVVENS